VIGPSWLSVYGVPPDVYGGRDALVDLAIIGYAIGAALNAEKRMTRGSTRYSRSFDRTTPIAVRSLSEVAGEWHQELASR